MKYDIIIKVVSLCSRQIIMKASKNNVNYSKIPLFVLYFNGSSR